MASNKMATRKIAVVAIMSALSALLMMLEFSIPLVPSFLKYDFSDLPALITSFALGPVWGTCVELIKNIVHLPFTQTSGVGELANFLVGTALVLPAGIVYKRCKTRKGAVIAAVVGTLAATAVSFPINYFITYPFYTNFMPMDTIISAYSSLLPAADTLPKALLIFNCPFTFVKGLINVVITFLIYKKISPVLKGTH